MKQLPVVALIFCSLISYSQSSLKQFKKLSCPEKKWVLLHPFAARNCWNLTKEARSTADSMAGKNGLDSFTNGGSLDAFRHGYWMALISQRYSISKAVKLGKAHEKGNKRSYKKNQKEEGELPDLSSMIMDLHNNLEGALQGHLHKKASRQELSDFIIRQISEGRFRIILRNVQGKYINKNGRVIDATELREWNNGKVIVPSDFKIIN